MLYDKLRQISIYSKIRNLEKIDIGKYCPEWFPSDQPGFIKKKKAAEEKT